MNHIRAKSPSRFTSAMSPQRSARHNHLRKTVSHGPFVGSNGHGQYGSSTSINKIDRSLSKSTQLFPKLKKKMSRPSSVTLDQLNTQELHFTLQKQLLSRNASNDTILDGKSTASTIHNIGSFSRVGDNLGHGLLTKTNPLSSKNLSTVSGNSTDVFAIQQHKELLANFRRQQLNCMGSLNVVDSGEDLVEKNIDTSAKNDNNKIQLTETRTLSRLASVKEYDNLPESDKFSVNFEENSEKKQFEISDTCLAKNNNLETSSIMTNDDRDNPNHENQESKPQFYVRNAHNSVKLSTYNRYTRKSGKSKLRAKGSDASSTSYLSNCSSLRSDHVQSTAETAKQMDASLWSNSLAGLSGAVLHPPVITESQEQTEVISNSKVHSELLDITKRNTIDIGAIRSKNLTDCITNNQNRTSYINYHQPINDQVQNMDINPGSNQFIYTAGGQFIREPNKTLRQRKKAVTQDITKRKDHPGQFQSNNFMCGSHVNHMNNNMSYDPEPRMIASAKSVGNFNHLDLTRKNAGVGKFFLKNSINNTNSFLTNQRHSTYLPKEISNLQLKDIASNHLTHINKVAISLSSLSIDQHSEIPDNASQIIANHNKIHNYGLTGHHRHFRHGNSLKDILSCFDTGGSLNSSYDVERKQSTSAGGSLKLIKGQRFSLKKFKKCKPNINVNRPVTMTKTNTLSEINKNSERRNSAFVRGLHQPVQIRNKNAHSLHYRESAVDVPEIGEMMCAKNKSERVTIHTMKLASVEDCDEELKDFLVGEFRVCEFFI